jgi:hypothetical protein
MCIVSVAFPLFCPTPVNGDSFGEGPTLITINHAKMY